MRTDVVGLTGGNKQFWLRVHQKEIKRYYFDYGPEATMQEFNMRPDTLARCLAGVVKPPEQYTKSDRAIIIAQVAKEGVAELRGRVRMLEEQIQCVSPVLGVLLQIGDALNKLSEISHKVKNIPNIEESQEKEW